MTASLYDRTWLVIGCVGAIAIFGYPYWPNGLATTLSGVLLAVATVSIVILTLFVDRPTTDLIEADSQDERQTLITLGESHVIPVAVYGHLPHAFSETIVLDEQIAMSSARTRSFVRDMIRDARPDPLPSYKEVIRNAAELACELNGRIDVVVTKSGDLVLKPGKRGVGLAEIETEFRIPNDMSLLPSLRDFDLKPN